MVAPIFAAVGRKLLPYALRYAKKYVPKILPGVYRKAAPLVSKFKAFKSSKAFQTASKVYKTGKQAQDFMSQFNNRKDISPRQQGLDNFLKGVSETDPFNLKQPDRRKVGLAKPEVKWGSPENVKKYYDSLPRNYKGIPLSFLAAGGADGADLIGTGGKFHVDFASEGTNRVADVHDYLYTHMGANDPFFDIKDRRNPDKFLVKQTAKNGHLLDAFLIGTGLGAGNLADKYLKTNIVRSHNQNSRIPFSFKY